MIKGVRLYLICIFSGGGAEKMCLYNTWMFPNKIGGIYLITLANIITVYVIICYIWKGIYYSPSIYLPALAYITLG